MLVAVASRKQAAPPRPCSCKREVVGASCSAIAARHVAQLTLAPAPCGHVGVGHKQRVENLGPGEPRARVTHIVFARLRKSYKRTHHVQFHHEAVVCRLPGASCSR